MLLKTNNTRKILIIGSLPESAGLGGVTIHIKRFLEYLQISEFKGYAFLDYKNSSIPKLIISIIKYNYVHIHVSNPYARLLISLLSLFSHTKVITTFHGNYSNLPFLSKILLFICLKLTYIPIAINQPSFELCVKYNKKTILLPAFIPPQDGAKLDSKTALFIDNIRAKGKPIISTNAYNVSYDKSGNEIYGISFLFDYFRKHSEYSFVMSDPSGNYGKLIRHCSDNIYFISYPHNYYELLKKVDIFIRNTSTDGDALSVKESLHVGCKTICTDVVNRPEGCILFSYCDESSLDLAIQSAINVSFHPTNIQNGAILLKQLYSRLL